MKIISLDLHDFSVIRSRMDLLLELKEHYPKLKVSMFTIPYDYEMEMSQLNLNRHRMLKTIHENLDWIQIIPHGLMHIPREFENCDRHTMKLAMKGIKEAFDKDGLHYINGFCAPQWLWNEQIIKVLDDAGWWGAVDKNQPDMLKTKRYYQYTHSIDEPFWEAKEDILNLHGHMTLPSQNNLEDCFLNLMKMPRDVEFKYVTEFIQE